MKIIFVTISISLCMCLHAQDTIRKDNKVIDSFVSVQVPAEIIGGQQSWIHFLQKNIHSDVAAKHGAKPGNYTVTISFLVDTTGKITSVQVVNDPGYGITDDVVKAFKHCPLWTPAMLNGKKVIYRQKQNITYQVTEQ